jgi:hypothetical protein
MSPEGSLLVAFERPRDDIFDDDMGLKTNDASQSEPIDVDLLLNDDDMMVYEEEEGDIVKKCATFSIKAKS